MAGAISLSSAASAQGASEEALEEIVVTATKREQALADIPMSVTVLDGDALLRQQADNFQDMVPLIPGLSINSSTRGSTRLTLRGINTGGVASTVGVYVGDVPFGSSTGLANGAVLAGDFDTFDLARVEVLRGPQGTLYGASSLSGVLKYVPNPANTEEYEVKLWGAMENVEGAADTGYALSGAVNVPLGDQFALRATAFYRADDGYIDSIGNNPIAALQDPGVNIYEGTFDRDGLNTVDTYGGRLQLLYQPNDDFSINLMGMVQSIESGAPTTVDADPVSFEPVNSTPVQSRYQENYDDFSYEILSATIDWDFDALTLQSVTSVGNFEQDFQTDAAIAAGFTGGPALSQLITFIFDSDPAPPIDFLLGAVLPQITSTDKVSQEFRLVSHESDKLEWLVGAYFTDEDSLIDQVILAVDPGTQTPATGFPLSELAVASITSNYKETALFANATWFATPKLGIEFGARYSDNEQSATQVTSGPLAGDSDFSVESSEQPFTWSFSPRYEINDNTSTYLRIATGFRPGGPNVVPPTAPPGTPTTYDSDSLTSYELGLKTTSANGLFALDVAIYQQDWEDIQLFTTVNGFGVNANGGTAESTGLEFTASLMPTEGLVLSLNGAYTDSQLTEDGPPELGGLDGDPLPYVPDWSIGLLADYEWTLSGGSIAYVGGTIGYTGERTYDFDERDANGNLLTLPTYTTLDLRLGLQMDRWNVELYGKNLTDERGITSVGTANTVYTGTADLAYIRPMTYGLAVGFDF